ncbi:MAG TPA: hypothetical protein VNT99_15035, partial [Methylomirabilota bacterium]|nr:hypothetical protein [Methylomirabilota bacterium]
PNGQIYSPTHPTNDWHIVELLVSLLNTNDARTLTSINTTSFNAWAATLAGLTTLSNAIANPFPGQPAQYETNIITADAPQVAAIVDSIQRIRISLRGGYFHSIMELLRVPELSSASPWLNLTGFPSNYGMTDEGYEVLPSELLSRVRADPVGTVTQSNNTVELRFIAFDNYAYRVEGTSDFATWTTVSEPHYSTNGVFTLPVSTGADRRFFRARLLP